MCKIGATSMQPPNQKSQLLGLIQTEHTQLEALLSSLSEEQLLRGGVTDSWSVKEELYTHLANNTGNHYAEHRQAIEAELNLRDRGMSSSP